MGAHLRVVEDEVGKNDEVESTFAAVIGKELEKRPHRIPPYVALIPTDEYNVPRIALRIHLHIHCVPDLLGYVVVDIVRYVLNEGLVWVIRQNHLQHRLHERDCVTST